MKLVRFFDEASCPSWSVEVLTQSHEEKTSLVYLKMISLVYMRNKIPCDLSN